METKMKDIKPYYEIHGSGRPIIMLHGGGPDHRLMKGCMEPVFRNRSGWKRIYFDLPGMGQTPASWINNSDHMLQFVLDFIDSVIPNQTFLLAGESYGGYLARGIIYKRPQAVDGLLLICPVIIPDQRKRKLPERVILCKDEPLLSTLQEEEAKEFSSFSVIQNRKIWERTRFEILPGLKVVNQAFLDRLLGKGYAFSFNVDQPGRPFENPALFIMGRQDHMVGYHDAYEIIKNYPRASVVILDNAGHNLQIEQEKLFTALTSEWLDRCGKNRNQ